MPKTLNALMKHLRASGIEIKGSQQKRRLKNIGYYHGYKGYRFAGTAKNRLPLTNFSQIATLCAFDTQLKSLFYPSVMSIETALKNYTLEAVLSDSKSEAIEDIWQKSLTDYRNYTNKAYRKAWERRQRLLRQIDNAIYHYRERPVIGHFRDADKDLPIWALFEVMTLGEFGTFYDCLDNRVKSAITRDMGMPVNLDSNRRLLDIIYLLKDFRNAIAHNCIVLDVRFQNGAVNKGIFHLLKQETGISGVDFTDITDYVILIVYLMHQMDFTKTECKQLIKGYKAIIERYRVELPFNIYSKIIETSARKKLIALRYFVSAG